MTCEVISTGGMDGNAVLVNGTILFDCGAHYRRLKPWIEELSLVFLTHSHCDHFNIDTIRKLRRHHPKVRFVCCRNLLVPLVTRAKVSPNRIIQMEPGVAQVIRGWGTERIEVLAFPLVHEVPNVGYFIRITGGEEDGSALYATDTRYMPISAPDLDLYMIEGSYHQAMADSHMDSPFWFRRSQNHMSIETAVDWLRDNADHERSRIVFLHGYKEGEDDSMDSGVFQPDQTSKDNEAGGCPEADQPGCEPQCHGGWDAGEPVALGGPERH